MNVASQEFAPPKQGGPGEVLGARERAALGALINIAGRQRMLSHRAVMFLSLSRTAPSEVRGGLLNSAGDALGAFEKGVDVLLNGEREHDIPPLFSARVRTLLAEPRASGDEDGRSLLERFTGRGQACLQHLRGGRDGDVDAEILSLANLVGGDLLPLLNGIVAAYEHDLADGMQADAERAAEVRAVMNEALADIEQMGSKIRLIAFNALIEAARAGEAGRAFSVIAEEIKTLGTLTRQESVKMQTAISHLFGASSAA